MGRKYTYETTIDIFGVGERDVKVSFECPDYAFIENVEVLAVEGDTGPVCDELAEEIVLALSADEHNDRMMQEAYEADAERWAEDQDRRDEAKAERAGWRV